MPSTGGMKEHHCYRPGVVKSASLPPGYKTLSLHLRTWKKEKSNPEPRHGSHICNHQLLGRQRQESQKLKAVSRNTWVNEGQKCSSVGECLPSTCEPWFGGCMHRLSGEELHRNPAESCTLESPALGPVPTWWALYYLCQIWLEWWEKQCSLCSADGVQFMVGPRWTQVLRKCSMCSCLYWHLHEVLSLNSTQKKNRGKKTLETFFSFLLSAALNCSIIPLGS